MQSQRGGSPEQAEQATDALIDCVESFTLPVAGYRGETGD